MEFISCRVMNISAIFDASLLSPIFHFHARPSAHLLLPI
jgi:hypothetical protein